MFLHHSFAQNHLPNMQMLFQLSYGDSWKIKIKIVFPYCILCVDANQKAGIIIFQKF